MKLTSKDVRHDVISYFGCMLNQSTKDLIADFLFVALFLLPN